MTALMLPWGLGLFGLAILMAAWRLLRGPSAVDRILALDTLYVLGLAVLVLLGISQNDPYYFDLAMVVALLGFVGTVALARFVGRGKVA